MNLIATGHRFLAHADGSAHLKTARRGAEPRREWRPGWLLAWVLWLVPAVAGATTVLEVSFATLVEDAEVIAVGTVSAIESEYDAQTETPWTLVTFSDLEVLKGTVAEPTLTLQVIGGPLPDGTVLGMVGTPEFHVGERSVVFSEGNGHYVVPLVGLWQGVYRVVFDAERGIDTIHDHAGQPVSTLPTSEGRMLHGHVDPPPAQEFGAGQQGMGTHSHSHGHVDPPPAPASGAGQAGQGTHSFTHEPPPPAAASPEAMPLSTFTRLIAEELDAHP